MFAILRFFSSEFKNEVKCFSVNIQYSTEMKDKVQTKEGSKIKILKLFKSAHFLCELFTMRSKDGLEATNKTQIKLSSRINEEM